METLIVILYLALTFVSVTFGQHSLTFTIYEEQPSGGQVGSVADVPLNIQEEERASVRFSFFNNDNPSQLYFTIGDVNGIIRTQVRLDRESVCRTLITTTCELDFKVAARTDTFFETINVKVIIEDINDNAPLFTPDSMVIEIPEGVNAVNTQYGIPSAEDPDTGSNYGIQSYEINPPSDMFDLISEKQLDGTFKVEIVVKKELNREALDSFQIRIVAKDGGIPPKSGTLIVDIKVSDINDNKPVFDQPSYNVSVDEGLSQGSIVLTVHATDLDIGENGKVTYRISDRFVQILQDFSINSTSGVISVAREKLVYQPSFHYSFIVEAVDSGSQPQVSQVYVYIYVQDTGNNPPKVTLSLLSPGNVGFVNISENSKNGSFVAHVTVEDSDTGDNGKVECYVMNSFFNVVKLQEEGAYKVVVTNTLNREVLDMHNVTVTCSDFGQPRLSSVVSFLVRVTDFNDNRPEFQVQNYKAKIKENTVTEQVILQVSASDKDLGDNQKIHYEIMNQDKISINPVTGVISASPFFDREMTPIVTFTVLAIDSGEIPLTGTATVTLTIEDVNDNKPTFDQGPFEFQIQENLKTGTIVAQLSARDLDSGSNGIFTFASVPEPSEARFPFDVFDTGIIQLNQELNREEISTYNFQVTVTDQGTPPLSSTALVTVIVTDDNDNRPNITFPTKQNKTVSIYYPSDEVTIVTQVEAHDLDAGENQTLHYSIQKGNELRMFRINEETGEILVNDYSVTIDQDVSIALMIEVRDKGVRSLASTAELIVNVIYTNATYGAVHEESSKFVVIVVVVVIVTVILSALIIGVIFLLRSIDRKRKTVENTKKPENAFSNKSTLFIMNNSGESSTDSVGTNTEVGRKKKEVSFSLEDQDSISNYQHTELRVNMSPEPLQSVLEKAPSMERSDSTQDLYDKVTTRLENLKLQRMLQLAKQQQHVVHPDDSRSESSGETSSGDSGRGASEEEVTTASPSHDEQKMFEYSLTAKVPPASQVPFARPDSYSAVPPPIPCRTYKPYSSFNNNQNYSPNQRQYLSAPTHYRTDLSVLDPNMLSWQHSQPHSHQPITSSVQVAQKNFDYYIAQNRNRRRSQDDDDCSTTTSGSYTLHSVEDLL